MSLLKKELRKTLKSVLQSVEKEEIERQSCIVTEKILNNPRFVAAERVSIFVSTTGEICTDELIRKSLDLGKQVFVPQFAKGNPIMRMVRLPTIEAFETLSTTLWNIRQPSLGGNWDDYFLSGSVDIVLAPGVAFTPSGHRLGHGMGYYDRWFAEHEKHFGCKPYAIGIGLKCQVVERLPTTDTDVTMDEIVTA